MLFRSSGIASQPAPTRPARTGGRQRLSSAVESLERELISATLEDTRGNISETARVLGLTRRGLYLKMRRLGIGGAQADTE